MSIIIEVLVILVAIAVLYLLYILMKNILVILANSIAGLLVLLGLNWFFEFDIAINLWSLLAVGIGGFVGLIMVVVLHFLGIAF